jgi:hypothetical protein
LPEKDIRPFFYSLNQRFWCFFVFASFFLNLKKTPQKDKRQQSFPLACSPICEAMRSNAKQCEAMRSNAKQCEAMRSNAKQCEATGFFTYLPMQPADFFSRRLCRQIGEQAAGE